VVRSLSPMHSKIAALFDDVENRYLKPEELTLVGQYVESIPARLDAYRALRDRELEVMQQVADQLQREMAEAPVADLERCIKNALLLLRCCAMGMLLNDETFVQERLLSWLNETLSVYNTRSIDMALHRLLNQRLSQVLSPKQISLVGPHIKKAQTLLLQPTAAPVPTR
jgi:hypothetical protein